MQFAKALIGIQTFLQFVFGVTINVMLIYFAIMYLPSLPEFCTGLVERLDFLIGYVS